MRTEQFTLCYITNVLPIITLDCIFLFIDLCCRHCTAEFPGSNDGSSSLLNSWNKFSFQPCLLQWHLVTIACGLWSIGELCGGMVAPDGNLLNSWNWLTKLGGKLSSSTVLIQSEWLQIWRKVINDLLIVVTG